LEGGASAFVACTICAFLGFLGQFRDPVDHHGAQNWHDDGADENAFRSFLPATEASATFTTLEREGTRVANDEAGSFLANR